MAEEKQKTCRDCVNWLGDDTKDMADCKAKVYTAKIPGDFIRCKTDFCQRIVVTDEAPKAEHQPGQPYPYFGWMGYMP